MEKKREESFWEEYWIYLLFLLGVCIQIALAALQPKNNTTGINTAITIIFFTIILVLFIIANQKLLKGINVRLALWRATETIWALAKENPTNIKNRIFEEEYFFADSDLQAAFDAYKIDSVRMKDVSEDANVDIENYINQKLLEDVAGINFLDQIAGALTGLGILGTFVGLSIGLSKFNIGSGDISQQLQPLMDGIKIAFHTSIIGLVYSLIYGFIYNKGLSSERAAVDEFLEEYRKYVVPVTEGGSTETFIKYQQRLVELLSAQISNQQDDAKISQEMLQEQKKLYELTESVNKQNVAKITASIDESIVPRMEQMSSALGTFMERTHEDQKEELEKLVNNFVTLMHQSLGDSFASLGEVLSETTSWQKHMLDEMKTILEQINILAIDLATINHSIEDSIEHVSSYTEKIDTMQDGITHNLDMLNTQNEVNTELCITANEKLTQINQANSAVAFSMKNFLKEAEKQATSIEDMNQRLHRTATEEIEKLNALTNKTVENISSVSEKAINGIASVNADSVKTIRTTTENIEKDMRNQTVSHMAAVQKVSEAHLKDIEGIADTNRRNLENTFRLMEREIEGKLKQLTDMKAIIKGDIENATRALTVAADGLNDDMVKQINSALESFDINLAKATSHLSGTIRAMEDSTNQVPMVINQTYVNLEKTFREMQIQLDQYLSYADKLHHNLEQKWNQLNKENWK